MISHINSQEYFLQLPVSGWDFLFSLKVKFLVKLICTAFSSPLPLNSIQCNQVSIHFLKTVAVGCIVFFTKCNEYLSAFTFSTALSLLKHCPLLEYPFPFGFYDTLFLVAISFSYPFLCVSIGISSSSHCPVDVRVQEFCVFGFLAVLIGVFQPFQ